MNLRILLTFWAVVFMSAANTPDVHAVSLADLLANNGTIVGAGGNLRFENFTATLSTQGDVSPTTLNSVTVSGFGSSLEFSGPFTAHSTADVSLTPATMSLSVGYTVTVDTPGGIDRFSLLIPQRPTITGVTRTDIAPSAGFRVIESVPGINPPIGICSSARFGCPNNDAAFLPIPISGGRIGLTINVSAAPEPPIGIPGGPTEPQPTSITLPSVVQTVGIVFPIAEPSSAVFLFTGLLTLAIARRTKG